MNASEELRSIVESVTPRLEQMAGPEVTERPAPGKWSKTEILGHLTDSAANNHHRFVRAQLLDQLDFPSYDQDRWVEIQDYAGADWREQLSLWRAYNLHLARVIERIPEATLNRRCRIRTEGVMMLGEIVDGYLIHLRHHLGQLLPDFGSVRQTRAGPDCPGGLRSPGAGAVTGAAASGPPADPPDG